MIIRTTDTDSTSDSSSSEEHYSPTNNDHRGKVECVDVAIIGAGWAGLGAANALRKRGVTNFKVLEARDRVGGRSVTTYVLGEDVPVDLGSAWVQGKKGNPIQALVDENDIPHASTTDADAIWDDGNRSWLGASREKKLAKLKGGFMKYMRSRQYWDGEDTSLQTVFEDYVRRHNIGEGTDEFRELHMLLSTDICLEYGSSLSQMSLYWWDYDELLAGGDSYLGVPGGGYSRIVDRFAKPVLPNIQLSSKVIRIYHGGCAARVCYVDGGEKNRVILAKHVVVTLPLGVLKSGAVHFSPSLPPAKRAAISNLGTGLLNKCVLYWEDMKDGEIFWPKEKEWIMRIAPRGEQGKWTEFYNAYGINGGKPVLVGWAAGKDASRVERLSDAEVTAEAVASLRSLFGTNNVPEPTKSIVTRWGKDEFARGAYSFQQVGSGKASRKDLAKPVGDMLFFAGEATSNKFSATAHGALLSGEKAALSILPKLGITPKRRERSILRFFKGIKA